jgi:hypothetical protein
MKLRVLSVALLATALTACATPTPYAPAIRSGGPGYMQTRIEADRFRIAFRGAGEAATLETFVLRRAAELTLEQRRHWFVVDARGFEPLGGGGPRTSVSIGAGGWSGGRTSVGVGTSIGIPLGRGTGEGVARLDIRLGSGPKPGDPQAYDARAVLANLAPPPR